MSVRSIAPVGGKDLRDFKDLSRSPEIGYLQKQRLPGSPRRDGGSSPGAFQRLGVFLSANLVAWFSEYLRYRIGFKHPFPTYDDPAGDDGVYPLCGETEGGEDVVRVAVAGDWGTGTDEAHTVAKWMAARDPHYTLHLGDVYFVGDPVEVKENFLGAANPKRAYAPCRWPLGSRGGFALNGNHEMYARGYGYFDLILPAMGVMKDGAPQGQKASFFCLENKYWRVIALDTGYNSVGVPLVEQFVTPDCALPDPLLAWLRDVLRQKEDRRGVVLLSHHQYFSRFDDGFVKPAEQMAEFIDRPVLWFWGHEHRMAVYEPRRTGAGVVAYGRCLGHGGMPVDLPPAKPKNPDCAVEFVDGRRYHNDEGLDIGVNGFAALTFEGADLKIEYVDVADTVIFSESWRTDAQGRLARIEAAASVSQTSPPEQTAPVS